MGKINKEKYGKNVEMTSGMEESVGESFPHFWSSRWMRTKIEEEKK